MARVKKILRSRKEYNCCKCGNVIPVGSPYQSIKFAYRPIIIHCDECGFKRWETVQSDYLQQLYMLQDNLCIESADDIQILIDELENLSDMCDERFENMPEGLQSGNAGQILETRRDSLIDIIDEINNLDEWLDDDTARENNPKEDDESDDDYDGRIEDIIENNNEEIKHQIEELVSSIEE